MPRLMGKKDWLQTVAYVGSAERVWYENVSAADGVLQLSMPERGVYRVILVKVGVDSSAATTEQKKSARNYIGYCRSNYNGLSNTSEIMKELREGEESASGLSIHA